VAGLRLHRDIDPLCACACNGATDTTFTHPTGFCIDARGRPYGNPTVIKADLFRTSGAESGFCDDNFIIGVEALAVTCESGKARPCVEIMARQAFETNCTFSVTIDGYVGPTGELNEDDAVYITGIFPFFKPTIDRYICTWRGQCAATITGVRCDDEACYAVTTWMVCKETVNTAPCLSTIHSPIICVKQQVLPFLNQVTDLAILTGLYPPVHTGLSAIEFGSENDYFDTIGNVQ